MRDLSLTFVGARRTEIRFKQSGSQKATVYTTQQYFVSQINDLMYWRLYDSLEDPNVTLN